MSLIEPLLPKEEVENQNTEKYSNDPLTNLEKSIESLSSIEFKSYEIDGASDIEFSDEYPKSMIKIYDYDLENKDIWCATTFNSNLAIGRIDGTIKIHDLDTKEEKVLKGHSIVVTCLQVTINKDFLVSGSQDKTIIIWNLETYNQERVFKSDSEVFCLVVTSGYNLFSGSLDDGLIRKWNFWDENETSTLSGHEGGITCMKSSKNNQFLFTGSLDETLRVWSIESSQEIKGFNIDCREVYKMEITEDDKYLVFFSNYRVYLWDLNKREMIEEIELMQCMSINIVNNCIIYSDTNKIAFYNIGNQTENKEILIKGNMTAIACSNKNNLVCYGLDNNISEIIDTKSPWNNFAEFKDFDSQIYKMLFIGNNDEYLASIMENGKIKIHEIYKESTQEDFSIDINCHAVKLTRDRKYLILYNAESLSIWNYIEEKAELSNEKFKLVMVKDIEVGSLQNLSISYDDKYFVFCDDNIIYLYSFQEMKEVVKLETQDHISCLSISKENQFIVAGKNDGSISVFDIEKKCKISDLEALEGLNNCIEMLEITKNNDYFITVDDKDNLTFWSFLEKKLIKNFHFTQRFASLALNDKYNCAVVSRGSWIEIWNIQTQVIVAKFQDFSGYCGVISEDETYLLLPQTRGFTMWSFEYMKEIESGISNHDVYFLDMIRDNKYIIVGGEESYVRLWSCEEKRFIATIDLFVSRVNNAKFIGDGKSIVAWNSSQVRIHNIEQYFDCNRADSYVYFSSGMHDKIVLQKFIKWIKSPSEHPWNNLFLDIVVGPIGYSALHYLCIYDRVDLLSIGLKNGGEIFRDNQNMSPLSYALVRSSRRCIDEILNYVINLEDDKMQYYCIHQLRDDIPLLFNANSINLVPFLEVLFRRRADKDHVGFYEVIEELPMSIFSPISKVYTSTFTGKNDIEKKETAKQNVNLVQFWGSPWGYNYSVGSEESLFLLKKLDESQNENIFQTLIVQSIIREKWEYLWSAIIAISIIYWLNLITMIWYMFDPSSYILGSFIVLNGILALYEFLQFITKPIDYVSEIWNLVDCIRMALSIIWAILEFNNESIEVLSFAVVFFNFLRGLTYFRAFDFTRFYVRLILMALTDSFAFLIIFLYSTLAFGVLYASLNATLSFGDMWTMAYELNMGNFDNDGYSFLQYSCFTLATLINVVMMLNLLVSTLGDTFDRFQMITDILDTKEMLQLVLEFESMMFWARSEQAKLRNKGKLMYLQRCDHFQDSDVPDKWQGKIKEISLKIDAVKDDILGNKKGASEELKKLEEKIESQEKSINGKIEAMESKIVDAMESKINEKVKDIESKISGIAEILEIIKTKLDS